MRIVGNIPHSQFTVTLFSANDKYIVKIELGQFEQTFKVNQSSVGSVDTLKKMFDDSFMEGVMERFINMREQFRDAYSNL